MQGSVLDTLICFIRGIAPQDYWMDFLVRAEAPARNVSQQEIRGLYWETVNIDTSMHSYHSPS